MRARVRKKGLF